MGQAHVDSQEKEDQGDYQKFFLTQPTAHRLSLPPAGFNGRIYSPERISKKSSGFFLSLQ
jgi:hypothetical protein